MFYSKSVKCRQRKTLSMNLPWELLKIFHDLLVGPHHHLQCREETTTIIYFFKWQARGYWLRKARGYWVVCRQIPLQLMSHLELKLPTSFNDKLFLHLGPSQVYGVFPGLVIMKKVLETEELSLQYGGVSPIDLNIVCWLGDVAGRELNKDILLTFSITLQELSLPWPGNSR